MRPRHPMLLAILALTGTIAACNPFGDVGYADDEARLAALYDEMLALTGDASATDVAQCRTVAVGSKPCGGPWTYLVYSTAVTDSVLLAALAAEHARIQKRLNERNGAASDCAFVTPPPVALVDGACVAAR